MKGNVIPKDFAAAVKDIKLAILQARAKAAHLANAEALKLYFFVGGYISKKTRNAKWVVVPSMRSPTSCRSNCRGCVGFRRPT